ncbi:lectizyme-like [Leguminivora glycinivorella]|uniref:lectizyme-like n=1 Tax=Leguminivora glycinivorella TaxID=1035111 RepID=UPI00200EF097|nr:lectizyme-like [Leguminivora glycinivorella]
MWQTMILVTLCYCGEGRRRSLRVHQGMEDIYNEFPFAVSLEGPEGDRMCTGSLIALNWVVTAGHCTIITEWHIISSVLLRRRAKTVSKSLQRYDGCP